MKNEKSADIFDNLFFFFSIRLGFREQKFFLEFFADILTSESGSVGPHNFADLDTDPECQKIVDPMDLSTAFEILDRQIYI